MSDITFDIEFKRADKTYTPGEMVSGFVVITSKGGFSHNGITLLVDGMVQLQMSTKNTGAFEAFYNSVKPITMMNLLIEVAKPGKLPDGETKIPFEFKLAPAAGLELYTTYHGVFINIGYLIKGEMKRGFLSKDLTKNVEFIVNLPGKERVPDQKIPFHITNDSLTFNKAHKQVYTFDIEGELKSAVCDIDGALAHYEKAIELEPYNVTFTNNKATCLIKQKKYQEAVDVCTKAIEEGREHHADFESIAKAYTKIASAEAARNNLEAAIAALNASLLEKKDPIVKRELTRIEALKAKRDAAAYENPEIAEQEKNEGNKCFREGDIPKAIEHYSEAIRRAPRDPKLYSNRAGAYSKLGEMPMALKDCDKAIELDPKFAKAYTRKGYCHIQMKEYHKALDDYNEALRIDPNNAEAIGGIQSVNAAIAKNSYSQPDEEQIKHAMADPEIQNILKDPGMQQILQEMQTNPMKAQSYLNDPKVYQAFMKLRAAGIIR